MSETFHSFQNIMHHKDHIIKTAFFEGGGLSADRYLGNAQIFLHFFQFYFFSSQNDLKRMLKKIVSALFEERGGGGSAYRYLGQGPEL